MSEQEQVNWDELGKEIEAIDSGAGQVETAEAHATPHMVAQALGSITRIMARKTGIPELELTSEDMEDLEKALEPLDLSVLEQVSKYLPITLFITGYLIRVIMGIQEKKRIKLPEPPKPPVQGPQNESQDKTK